MSCQCDACSADAHAGSNRPWLPEIAYRLGTFASFREELLSGLGRAAGLEGMRSRDIDDYTVSVIEMWSAVADVLTFYSERIANEAFLRTATTRDAVQRLVRLLDYHLAHGTAARTVLAFTLEPGTTATIPARTRVQSVPAQGQKAQTYETLAELNADARLNRLEIYPQPEYHPPLAVGSTRVVAAPDTAAVAAAAALTVGSRVIAYAPTAVELLTVASVSSSSGHVSVTWADPVGTDHLSDGPGMAAYRVGRTFRLFGVDAPARVPDGASAVYDNAHPLNSTVSVHYALTDDLWQADAAANKVALDRRYDGLSPGARVLAVSTKNATTTVIACQVTKVVDEPAVRSTQGGGVDVQRDTVTWLHVQPLDPQGQGLDQLADNVRTVTIHELVGDPLRFTPWTYGQRPTTAEVYVPGMRTGWSTIEVGRTIEQGQYQPGSTLRPTDLDANHPVLIARGPAADPSATAVTACTLTGSRLTIDGDAPTLSALGLNSPTPVTALVSDPVSTPLTLAAGAELSVAIGAFPPQTIPLGIDGPQNPAAVAVALQQAVRAARPGASTYALAAVFTDNGRLLTVPGVPGDEVRYGASDNDALTVVALGVDPTKVRFADGVLSESIPQQPISGTVTVQSGQDTARNIVLNLASQPTSSLAAQLGNALSIAAQATSDHRLLLLPKLASHSGWEWLRITLRDQVGPIDGAVSTLLGNVIDASHGETVRDEVLGDGDGSTAFQRFALAKQPLTMLSGGASPGLQSTLQLFVNGELWQHADNLLGAGETDHVYTVHVGADNTTTVGFGDGTHGARIPTGRQNVVATYRYGSGPAGRVGSAAIRTLLDRPTGVKAVTNPLPSEGGAGPETLDSGRLSAPGSVRTFQRAVSLRDFEDTALSNREIAKAHAQWVWVPNRRVVHLTVAGDGGTTFTRAGLDRLARQFGLERDPNRSLVIDNYVPVAVSISATVTVEPNHQPGTVHEAATTALLQSFSFAERAFADPVHLSKVATTLQRTPGVAGVDIDVLDLKRTDPAFRSEHGVSGQSGLPQPRLLVLPARWSAADSAVRPAEIAVVEVPALDIQLRTEGGVS